MDDNRLSIEDCRAWVEKLLLDTTPIIELVYGLLLMLADEWAAVKFIELFPEDSSVYPYRLACFMVRIGEPTVAPLKR